MVSTNLTLPATMRALLLTGLYNVTVQDVAVPKLVSPTDAIVKLTTAGICGSDLYAYRGFSPDQDPYVLGHEGIGYVVQTGSGVSTVSVGDYVVIPDNFHHGQLEMQPTFPVSYGGGVQSPDVSGLQGRDHLAELGTALTSGKLSMLSSRQPMLIYSAFPSTAMRRLRLWSRVIS